MTLRAIRPAPRPGCPFRCGADNFICVRPGQWCRCPDADGHDRFDRTMELGLVPWVLGAAFILLGPDALKPLLGLRT